MFTPRHKGVSTSPRKVLASSGPAQWKANLVGILALVPLVFSGGVQAQKSPNSKKPVPSAATPKKNLAAGRALFVKNCSPCHGANGQGGEGPNLQKMALPEAAIIAMVQTGVKGEMPAFGSKFKAADLKALAAFVHSIQSPR